MLFLYPIPDGLPFQAYTHPECAWLVLSYIIPLFIYAEQNRNPQSLASEREPGYVLRHLGVKEPDAADALSRYAAKVVDERAS